MGGNFLSWMRLESVESVVPQCGTNKLREVVLLPFVLEICSSSPQVSPLFVDVLVFASGKVADRQPP